VPFTEINLQFLSCNEDSFFSEYSTEEGCKSKPIILLVLGSLGTFLAIVIGFVVLLSLRCYAFNDPNKLKRNYTFF